MPQVNVEGVVLRGYKLGEKDRILVLLTRHHGKIRVVAKGARRPGGRFAALEPLVEMKAAVYKGRNLHTLTQALIVTSHRRVRERIDRLAYGLFMAELIDLFTVEAEVQSETHDLLSNALFHLEETADVELLLAYFEVQLLRQMGLLPAWQQCTGCGTRDRPLVALSLSQGGLVCPTCAREPGVMRVDRRTVLLLRYLAQVDWDDYAKIPVPPVVPQLTKTLEQFIFYRLARKPRSYDFLTNMRGM